MHTKTMSKLIPLPSDLPEFLSPYLPTTAQQHQQRPFVTLTYAQSLDSRIAAKPGARTAISHLETKTMTHYLRSRHQGILIGSGTVLADDPGLNCRFDEFGESNGQIRPLVLDTAFKWNYQGSKLEGLVDKDEGLAPWVIVREESLKNEDVQEKAKYLETHGGKVISLPSSTNSAISWDVILKELYKIGLQSIMIEGGAKVINELLIKADLVDSLIITIGPVFLGDEGVVVSPPKEVALDKVKWWKGIQDSVLCARLRKV